MTDLAAVHGDVSENNDTRQLVGVWLSPTDYYYLPGHSREETTGKNRMEGRFDDLSWDDWVIYLNDSRPGRAWWFATEVIEGESAQAVLTRVRAQAASQPDQL